ncbi:Glutamate N-acetyltransferase @ N-acetylglutamate synthase [hydrothermal vent metagenome]|uniref:Glutamate N-acetyltransferase @ N-acetylglutamate synthase n=1 Tax=hydrothermal vent metagenome TaxID=652676 RepID=A0A3B1DDY9_9ZZZZ
MKVVKGGVTKPKGFRANGLCCGIKKSGKQDLALIVSDVPAVGACVFTKNSVIAAPLVVSKKHIRNNKIQAIITNSGNANCFTGSVGLKYAEQTTELIGDLLNISKQDVIVSSTGIISKPLQYNHIKNSVSKLVEGLSMMGATKAAQAILTTDLCTKEVTVEIIVGGKKVTIGACAKGSGMIAPNMATMLCFITTDAEISSKMLKLALKQATDKSFNCITIDGCMSTNDMVTVMANGLAGNKKITTANKDFEIFCEALDYVCLDLAKKIVFDGEGATKFIEIKVQNAKDDKQAKAVALKVANCNLVKTAAYGSNTNWGRVTAAVGALGIKEITEENMNIKVSSFKKKNISIVVNLALGQGQAKVYTSDLSKEYIRINAEYN